MSTKLRVVLFSFLVMCIIVNSSVVASAAPPGTGRWYYVNGYVKTSSGSPISGASVALYMNSNYMNTVATQANGYFTYSVYLPIYDPIPYTWKAVVSKSGYITATKTVQGSPSGTTNMGTIYLTPVPPPPQNPDIFVTESSWRNWDFSLQWFVAWGTAPSGTTYSVDLYWGEDSDFTGESPIQTWSTLETYYTYTIQDNPHRGDWWYRITAKAMSPYGNGYGEVTDLAMGIVLPLADTYTDEGQPWTNFGYEDILRAGTPYYLDQTRAYLKFGIDNPADVSSVSLLAYKGNNGHHHGVAVYSVWNSWTEGSIAWNNQPDYDIHDCIDADAYGDYGEWDCWDVTELARSLQEFSVVLIYKGDRIALGNSIDYTSRQGSIETRPHLLVQYRIDNQVMSHETDGLPSVEDLVSSDEFEYDALNLERWLPNALGDATPDEYWCSSGNLVVDSLSSSGEPAGWSFSQECNYPAGFQFDVGVGIGLQNLLPGMGSLLAGVQLTEIENDEEVVFCEFYLFYQFDERAYVGLYPLYIIGRIEGCWSPAILLNENPVHQLISPMDTILSIIRDPVTDHILIRYLNLPFLWTGVPREFETLMDLYHQGTVNSVKLVSLKITTTQQQLALGYFEFFRQMPVQLVNNPTPTGDPPTEIPGGYNFAAPLRHPGFNQEASVRNYWKNKDGDSVEGLLSPYDYSCENHYSWHLPESEELHIFSMIQNIIETDTFEFDSLKEQIVGFSVYVHSDSTVSMVRVEIGYEADGLWYESCGPWQVLNEGDDTWYLLSVSTQYALPTSLTQLEVRVVGIGYKDGDFSAYIDNAELALLATNFVEGIFGTAILTSQTYYANIDEQDYLEIMFLPMVTFTAAEGYFIDNVAMDVNIVPSGGLIEGEISPAHFVEGNDLGEDYIEPTQEDYEQWMQITAFLREASRWVTRIAAYGSGVGAPYSWFLGDAVGGIMNMLMLTKRNPGDNSDFSSNGNDFHANADIDYPHYEQPHVSSSTLGGDIRWRIHPTGHAFNPIIHITFTVTWCDSNTLWQVGTSVIGLSLVCVL